MTAIKARAEMSI